MNTDTDRVISTDECKKVFLRFPFIQIIDVLYGNIDDFLRSKKAMEYLSNMNRNFKTCCVNVIQDINRRRNQRNVCIDHRKLSLMPYEYLLDLLAIYNSNIVRRDICKLLTTTDILIDEGVIDIINGLSDRHILCCDNLAIIHSNQSEQYRYALSDLKLVSCFIENINEVIYQYTHFNSLFEYCKMVYEIYYTNETRRSN